MWSEQYFLLWSLVVLHHLPGSMGEPPHPPQKCRCLHQGWSSHLTSHFHLLNHNIYRFWILGKLFWAQEIQKITLTYSLFRVRTILGFLKTHNFPWPIQVFHDKAIAFLCQNVSFYLVKICLLDPFQWIKIVHLLPILFPKECFLSDFFP